MSAVSRFVHVIFVLAFAAMTLLAAVHDADARRAGGGGFGSRGTRTFSAPPVTRTAPMEAAPIGRTMTPQPATGSQPQLTPQPGVGAPRPGIFSGFGRSMIGGLVVGGLFGMLLGHGFGGGFGFLGMLLQIALIAGGLMLLLRFLANRRQGAYSPASSRGPYGSTATADTSFRMPDVSLAGTSAPKDPRASDEIRLSQADLDRFEALLTEIQTAYGSEDYAAIRALTTPEAMSYLAEELGENATKGVRNRVSNVKLLQGDIAEAWHENSGDYATLAMRYSSIDAIIDRSTGRLIDGDDDKPSETTEVWTFVRAKGSDWKLSAIQGTSPSRH